MAKRSRKTEKNTKAIQKSNSFVAALKSRQTQIIIGSFFILFSVFLCIAFISFFFSWQEDQSILGELSNKSIASRNLLGKIGAALGDFFIYRGFGISAFVIPYLLCVFGFFFVAENQIIKGCHLLQLGTICHGMVVCSPGFFK